MARYTFTCEHLDYDMFRGEENGVASKHTTEFSADTLETMLENFELFLRGSGFHFDGVLDVVKPEEDDLTNFGFSTDYENDEPVNYAWSKIVERHMTDMENDEIQRGACEICKLPLETMLQHNCFDEQCPLKTK
jgi:hypothetical protein